MNQGMTIDVVRFKFITHTGADCLSDSERLPRVDIDSWNTFEGTGAGGAFEDETGYAWLDQYYGKPMKGYRRVCELFCRESDSCSGFQYTPLVVTTAHDSTKYEADSGTRRRRG